jgi:hypothetical protein
VDAEVLKTLQAWVLTALVYPGLLFGVALALTGEWLLNGVRPMITPRIYRIRVSAYHLAQPVYDFLKLTGRLEGSKLGALPETNLRTFELSNFPTYLAPALALALLPFPGSPIIGAIGPVGDLVLVLALLVVYPLCKAALGLKAGDQAGIRAGRDIGRVVIGLVPVLASVAALLDVSRSGSSQLAGLTAAPESAAQALVRLLAGAALLVALPWWLDWRGSPSDVSMSAGTFAGKFLQRAALAAFWASIILPAPGDLAWAIVVAVGGSLVAYIAIRLISERWAVGMREQDAARLAWVTTLPVALLALFLSV